VQTDVTLYRFTRETLDRVRPACSLLSMNANFKLLSECPIN